MNPDRIWRWVHKEVHHGQKNDVRQRRFTLSSGGARRGMGHRDIAVSNAGRPSYGRERTSSDRAAHPFSRRGFAAFRLINFELFAGFPRGRSAASSGDSLIIRHKPHREPILVVISSSTRRGSARRDVCWSIGTRTCSISSGGATRWANGQRRSPRI